MQYAISFSSNTWILLFRPSIMNRLGPPLCSYVSEANILGGRFRQQQGTMGFPRSQKAMFARFCRETGDRFAERSKYR